ncbi:pyridoxamine 5'-phosphate oxidase family protein [Desulforhopalus sp. IMCC35007]|uniref:pyridoxamine 5'-phosphate oxidase family protein n=1 Tax=Desulforhopalus sp. IMCC35007 TaxID=2569543 RepID=UPI0010AE8D2B|nr:pyridoxamine 5'-phosphate oxidase family protein [Desulforhopalus sp. IMCC35007]TKB12246.1 pyridoxamine 5'-phosphate oxidase family protein [Desulforhopalus sp. IMCC35007]
MMSATEQEITKKIQGLLASQRLAVLSTQRDGQPYSSLMAFAFTTDLASIVVATGKSTRKHQNLLQESRVSLLVDNRTNSESDFHSAEALTVIGKAQMIEEAERLGLEQIYLQRHPFLQEFLASPSTAFLKIAVSRYLLVSRFQDVMEYKIGNINDLLL